MLGDTRTAALTLLAGFIDWVCCPRFDSEPVFGRLIDHESDGWFETTVEGATHTERTYQDRSAVLETTWENWRPRLGWSGGTSVASHGACGHVPPAEYHAMYYREHDAADPTA